MTNQNENWQIQVILAFPYAILHTFKPENIDDIKDDDGNLKASNNGEHGQTKQSTQNGISCMIEKTCEAITKPC